MNTNKDLLTYRYPRTMEEAFGPGHRGNVWEYEQEMHPSDKAVLMACAFAMIIFAAAVVV